MTNLVSVVETPAYLAQAERMMTEAEREAVVDRVAGDPLAGVLIKGTGGLRKLRIPLAGRGKRGGARVVYWFHAPGLTAVLLWVLAKNAASDLTPDQRRRVAQVADLLLRDFGGKK